MKTKFMIFFKKALIFLLCSLIVLGIGTLIALLISQKFNYKMQDVMINESFAVIGIGILLSLKGRPSGLNLQGAGQSNENAVLYKHLEVTRLEDEMERNSPDYYKNFFTRSVFEFALTNITFILGGLLMFITGYFLF